jgi:FixJ family two-component response regulator
MANGLVTDIAIIDDDRGICIALSSLMRSMGYNAHLFDSAEAFLDVISVVVVDCIFTDVQMPGIGGIALLRKLKELLPGVPVIIMTAYPEAGIREQALEDGARFFLAKPFGHVMISDCLATISGERSSSGNP